MAGVMFAALLVLPMVGCRSGSEPATAASGTPTTMAGTPSATDSRLPSSALPATTATFVDGPAVMYVDSGRIRVGVDKRWGGAIREIWWDGQNLVNNYDGGRLVAVSLYDANTPPGTHSNDTGWNPTPSDQYNANNPPLTYSFSANTLYVKSRYLQWYPDDKGGGPGHPIPSDVTVETWIGFVAADAIHLRYRTTNGGTDGHALTGQEYPFAYVRTPFSRFVRYDGDRPWMGENARTEDAPVAPKLGVSAATEHWGALVNSADIGLTLWAPQTYGSFMFKSFHNPGAAENSCNYLVPFAFLEIGPGSTHQTEALLFAGRWQDARDHIYRMNREFAFADTMPGYGTVDSPVPGGTVSGTTDIAGWALDDRKVGTVEIRIDGKKVGTATHGSARTDVAHDYPGVPGAPNFGFAYPLKTTDYPNGVHTIEAHVVDATGNASLLAPGKITVNISN